MKIITLDESLTDRERQNLARIDLELTETAAELWVTREALKGRIVFAKVGMHGLVSQHREVEADEEART